MADNTNNIEGLLPLVLSAAVEAGDEIMKVYARPVSEWEVEQKSDHSPLTLADRSSQAVIARALATTPYPVLSEEGAHESYAVRQHWHRLWVVDPLDGTKEFIKRNGEFTVNIALVEAGVPVLGVVYVPVSRRLFWGTAAGGAFVTSVAPDGSLHGKARLPLPREAGRPGYVVVASRSHLSPATADFIAGERRLHPDLEIHAAGSSLKICLVAEDRADVYPRLAPTMEWDTAAGHAVATAAGCEFIDAVTGAPVVYNKPDLHNPSFIVRRHTDGY